MDDARAPAIKARVRGSVTNRDEARSRLQEAGDIVIVERGCLRSAVIKCPCGCGEELVINLDSRIGPAWRLYRDERGLTLYPSIWRDSGCRSHFIVWHDSVLMCNGEWTLDEPTDEGLEGRVLAQLPNDRCRSFEEVASSLDAIPWSVLVACRGLVWRGLAREGSGMLQGYFQRCFA